MSEPLKNVPSQIGSVTKVDRMDTVDRQKLDPRVKLQLLMEEAKVIYGRDPRSGGFTIGGRPRVVLQLLIDMKIESITNEIRLERPVIAGTQGADVVGYWSDIPIVVRSSTVGDVLWCILSSRVPESHQIDRRRAGELRLAAHRGESSLEALRGN